MVMGGATLQIDYLQQANEELQSKVVGLETTNSSLTAQVNELSDKNLHVCEELEVTIIADVNS